ncbi:hypothetical protein BGZ76_010663 [Entomortierella beljakovae]|nr:hypothetical protein BGZ76_010663 [Entomortierella beljakovae]
MNLPGSNKKKSVQFKNESKDSDSDSDSNSIELADSSHLNKDEQDYYDPIYFDTDSDSDQEDSDKTLAHTKNSKEDGDGDDTSANTFNNGAADGLSVGYITNELEKSTLGSIKKKKKTSKKNQSHPTISDADLLYDPDQDDKDQEWLMKKIAANRPPGCKAEDIWTDAILSCPMCLAQLCFDCQQHEFYPHQFRAMFVENCRIIDTEILRFPKVTKKPTRNTKNAKQSSLTSSSPITSSSSSSPAEAVTTTTAEFKPSLDDDDNMAYHPVICEICNTKVAVYDQDEVYHFFNIIPDEV